MISTRITAVSARVGTRIWVTPAVGPVADLAPVTVVEAGSITGRARIGQALTATPPTWAPAKATTAYQWLSAGKPVEGATGARFVPRKGQLGKRISVRFTGTAPGRAAGSSTSSRSDPVGKAQPVLAARYSAGTVTVSITGTGGSATGKVTVKAGGRTYTAPLRGGRALVRTGAVAPGSRVIVVYPGNAWIQGARAAIRR